MIVSHHLRKPPSGSRLRRGSPLAIGLEFCVVFNGENNAVLDLVSGQLLAVTGNSKSQPGFDGGQQMFWPIAGASGLFTTKNIYPQAAFGKECSLFCRVSPNTTAGATQYIFGHTAGGNSVGFSAGLNTSNQFIVRRGSGSADRTHNTTIQAEFGWPVCFGATFAPTIETVPKLFLDGQKVSVGAAGSGAGGAASSGGRIYVGGLASSSWHGGIEIVAAWSRPLSDYEHKLLSADPYVLIKPRKISFAIGSLPYHSDIEAVAAVECSIALVSPVGGSLSSQSQIEAVPSLIISESASLSAAAESSVDIFKNVVGQSIYSLASAENDGRVGASVGVDTGAIVSVTQNTVAYIRFEEVSLPADTYIREAYLQLTPQTTASTQYVVSVYMQDQDYSWVPSSYGDYLARARTQAITVTLPTLQSGSPITIDVRSLIQRIKDTTSLRSTTAVVFYVDSTSTVVAPNFVSWESNSLTASKLFVEYGVYTLLSSVSTVTASASLSAELRLVPVLAANLSAVGGVSALVSNRQTFSCELSGVAQVVGGATPVPVEILGSLSCVSSLVVSEGFRALGVNSLYAIVTVVGETALLRSLPLSNGIDYGDTAYFRLTVNSQTVDVSQ